MNGVTPQFQFNPGDTGHVKALEDTTRIEFDEASTALYEDTDNQGYRKHLGFSVIGKNCAREIWYGFRWVQKPVWESKHKTHGQMMRLFEFGRMSEDIIIACLKQAGHRFEPRPLDENGFPTQHRSLKYAMGHAGGSMDEIGYLPVKYNFNERILYEFKTSNASEFNKLKKVGLRNHRQLHWAQMCVYGYDKQVQYGMYCVYNKDNSEMYFEFVTLDHNLGMTMVRKAEELVQLDAPPMRIANSAASFKCQFCPFRSLCHYDEAYDRNCRSCKHCKAIDGGHFHCLKYGKDIPDDQVIHGCGNHVECK